MFQYLYMEFRLYTERAQARLLQTQQEDGLLLLLMNIQKYFFFPIQFKLQRLELATLSGLNAHLLSMWFSLASHHSVRYGIRYQLHLIMEHAQFKYLFQYLEIVALLYMFQTY